MSLVIELFESENATISGAVGPCRLPQATPDFKFDLPKEALVRNALELDDVFREFPNPTPATQVLWPGRWFEHPFQLESYQCLSRGVRAALWIQLAIAASFQVCSENP